MRFRKQMSLGIRFLIADVGQSLLITELPGSLEKGSRDVHTQCGSSDGSAGGVTGGLTRAATDVEHPVAGSDSGGGAEPLIMQTQLGGKAVGMPDALVGRLGTSTLLCHVPIRHRHRQSLLSRCRLTPEPRWSARGTFQSDSISWERAIQRMALASSREAVSRGSIGVEGEYLAELLVSTPARCV